jgi:adenine-specific DNA methylase
MFLLYLSGNVIKNCVWKNVKIKLTNKWLFFGRKKKVLMKNMLTKMLFNLVCVCFFFQFEAENKSIFEEMNSLSEEIR